MNQNMMHLIGRKNHLRFWQRSGVDAGKQRYEISKTGRLNGCPDLCTYPAAHRMYEDIGTETSQIFHKIISTHLLTVLTMRVIVRLERTEGNDFQRLFPPTVLKIKNSVNTI